MKILKPLCLSMAFCLGTSFAAQAANDSALVNAIYESAKSNNRQSLYRIKKNGYSLDATDVEGNTALCRALADKNRKAYDLLRVMGANPGHPCVERLEAKAAEASSKKLVWRPSNYTYTAIGAVAFGGLVAAAASGGGGGGADNAAGGEGGSGEGGSGDNPGGTSPDVPGTGDEEVVAPINDWDTVEYRNGNFLVQINAAQAYANLQKQGITLAKVKVGIIDNGLDINNKEFTGQTITGYNYDYGPCREGDRSNCWKYEGDHATLVNEAGAAIATVDMTAEEYGVWAGKYPEEYNWDETNTSFAPLGGDEGMHGTHVAGIIAANRDGEGMHGVTDNAQLIMVRRDFSDLEKPIKTLVDDGAKVINMSLGASATETINASTVNDPAVYRALTPYLDAFKYAKDHNVVLVVAAGNESFTQSNVLSGIPLLSEYMQDGKTTYKTLINVVALGEDGRLASFSNQCGATKGYCLAAPGTNIISTGTNGEDYVPMEGTSMAAPVVTGSVALLMGAYPYMSAEEVVTLLLDTATDIPAEAGGEPDGVDEVYGHGLINLEAATKPQGELSVAAEGSVTGRRVSLNHTQIAIPAVFQGSLGKKMPLSVTAFDKYDRPFDVEVASMVRQTHSGKRNFRQDLYAFSRRLPRQRINASPALSFSFAASDVAMDGSMGFVDVTYRNDERKTSFFFSENTKYNQDNFYEQVLFNPYLAMNQAYGIRNAYNYNNNLNFSFGFTAGENGLYDGDVSKNDREFDDMAYAFDTAVSYKATDSVTVKAMSGILYEDDALLGLNGSGAFGVGDSDTYYAGLAIVWSPSAKWTFSGAYYQGWTKAKNLSSSLLSTSDLSSDSFAFDGRYALNKTDVIGLQISSPLRVYKGTAGFNLPVGRDDYSDKVYRQQFKASMKPDAREYKFSLYHSREINEDMGLRSQFDVRLNPDHQRDASTDYRIMFGFNWNL